jgi:hypothetical protein
LDIAKESGFNPVYYFQLQPNLKLEQTSAEFEGNLSLADSQDVLFEYFGHRFDCSIPQDVVEQLVNIKHLDIKFSYVGEALLQTLLEYGIKLIRVGQPDSHPLTLYQMYRLIEDWYSLEHATDWTQLANCTKGHFPVFIRLLWTYWHTRELADFTPQIVTDTLSNDGNLHLFNTYMYVIRTMIQNVRDSSTRSHILLATANYFVSKVGYVPISWL